MMWVLAKSCNTSIMTWYKTPLSYALTRNRIINLIRVGQTVNKPWMQRPDLIGLTSSNLQTINSVCQSQSIWSQKNVPQSAVWRTFQQWPEISPSIIVKNPLPRSYATSLTSASTSGREENSVSLLKPPPQLNISRWYLTSPSEIWRAFLYLALL